MFKTIVKSVPSFSSASPTIADETKTVEFVIEKAALHLFLENGVDAVAVEEIAAAAEISRRTFFRYFESKDDLLAATPKRWQLRTMQEVRERPEGESLIEAMIATARGRPHEEEAQMMRLSGAVMARCPDAWMRALSRLRRATDTLFADMVADRLRKAGRSDIGANVIGAGLAAIVVYVYSQWINHGCAGDFADQLEDGLCSFGEIFD